MSARAWQARRTKYRLARYGVTRADDTRQRRLVAQWRRRWRRAAPYPSRTISYTVPGLEGIVVVVTSSNPAPGVTGQSFNWVRTDELSEPFYIGGSDE